MGKTIKSELDRIKEHFNRCASTLGDYQSLSKRELFDGYCDADEADDASKKSQYYSALMLRYWHKIFKWKEDTRTRGLHPTDEDYVSWLADCLNDAFYYRSWRLKRHDHKAEAENGHTQNVWMENDKFYDDKNAGDISVNNFCGLKIDKELQASNKQVRKANALTYSLDAQQEENGDCALDMAGATCDDNMVNGVSDLISLYIKQNKYVEALILDAVVNQDVYKDEKIKKVDEKEVALTDEDGNELVDEETGEIQTEVVRDVYYTYNSQFDPRKLVKHLSTINQEFLTGYFGKTYDLTDIQISEAYTKLQKCKNKNSNFYNYIKKTFTEIKNSPRLLSYLTK